MSLVLFLEASLFIADLKWLNSNKKTQLKIQRATPIGIALCMQAHNNATLHNFSRLPDNQLPAFTFSNVRSECR
jgi:hypothetical protein